MKTLNTREVRELDRLADERFSIPGILLMEHASLGLAEVLSSLSRTGEERFLFLCGKGNNGGDGFAAARHLHNRGLRATILLAGRVDQVRKGSDAETNVVIAGKMGLPILEKETAEEVLAAIDEASPDFLVDAVLGTGLSSPVRGMLSHVFEGINARNLDVTAVDAPSGLDADKGVPLGVSVMATRTVTFAFAKKGFLKETAGEYCGEIIVKGIGLPREVADNPHSYL
jgi:hydroxyethylthiazole kinase-like uncharacterized protein yjeF